MANKDNLIPNSDLTPKERREKAKKAGIASGEARRKKKELRESLEILLAKDFTDKDGNTMSGADAISAKLFAQALKGNIKAFEVIRDTAGQKPVERVMVAEVEQNTIDEVDNIVKAKQNDYKN